MCGGGVCRILLLPLVDICLENNRGIYMAHVCSYVSCSDGVGVCGNICCVAVIVEDSVFLALEC